MQKYCIDCHAGDTPEAAIDLERLTVDPSFAVSFKTWFDSDAVGGEGFANLGDVQFVQDSTLERYLEAAKKVAPRTP